MKHRIMAICDKDERYLELLQSYLLKRKPAGFDIMVFSDLSHAITESKKEAFEIFLVGESVFDEIIKDLSAQKVFVLMEDGLRGITGYSFVVKYQSVEKLISQVLDEFAADEACSVKAACGKNKTKLISFYSPERHSGQAFAALCAAELVADRGGKVLYISMSAFSGFEELLGIKYNTDITDFMYFALKYPEKLLHKLESIKCTIHGVDYLPPALDYTDLIAISESDWDTIMDALLYSSDYTHIIVDMSEVCQGFYSILDKSDKVYIPCKKNFPVSKAALRQFENLIKAKEYENILKKSETFSLNLHWESHSFDLENLSGSPLGTHMKGIILTDEQ